MEIEQKKSIIEAILFAAGRPVSKNEFVLALELPEEDIENIMRRVNVADYESLFYLHRKLDEIGLNKALKKAGVKDGDTVRLIDYEMTWED